MFSRHCLSGTHEAKGKLLNDWQVKKHIFETIYFGACHDSCQVAERDGPDSTWEGSPASQTNLQLDFWDAVNMEATSSELYIPCWAMRT